MNYRSLTRSQSNDRREFCARSGGGAGSVVREGTTLAVGRDVAVAPAVAAAALRDTRAWPEWSPAIDAVASDDRFVETGTTGRVRVGGAWVSFRVTGATDRRWDWRVAGIPATGHRVDRYAGDPDRCRVVVEVPIVAAAYVPVCRRALDRFAALVEREHETTDEWRRMTDE
nr:SRPBCC family protein [Halorubrum aidingense]